MELWELAARESIRDLIARYNANGDSGRWAQVEELFAVDAIMDVDGQLLQGRDQIMGMFQATQRRVVPQGNTADEDVALRPAHTTMKEWMARGHKPFIRHFTATTQIDVIGPSEGRARSYYLLLTVHGLDHWGRYVDECGIRGGRWVFTRRQEVQEAALEGGWGAGAALDNLVRGLGFSAPLT